MPATTTRKPSPAHKAAMQLGREESRAISTYLAALESHRPRRGRRRTQESIDRRLVQIDKAMTGASPITRLSLVQERIDLQAELEHGVNGDTDPSLYEAPFVEMAKSYSERKGISYAAWRQVGVSPEVLRRAGISRN